MFIWNMFYNIDFFYCFIINIDVSILFFIINIFIFNIVGTTLLLLHVCKAPESNLV